MSRKTKKPKEEKIIPDWSEAFSPEDNKAIEDHFNWWFDEVVGKGFPEIRQPKTKAKIIDIKDHRKK